MSDQARRLCCELIKAECEEDVVALLRGAGYWDDPDQWRYYGDNELNFAQGGGQQSRADFAFNEKAVNSVDSVLTRLSIEAGVAPDSPTAPQTVLSRKLGPAAANPGTTEFTPRLSPRSNTSPPRPALFEAWLG